MKLLAESTYSHSINYLFNGVCMSTTNFDHEKLWNLIKDIKLYTRSDKTACHRWEANQFRLFLHMGAYWLLHSVRLAAPRKSRWRGATFETIRCVFVKIAVRVEQLKTRIKLSFPAPLPHADALGQITARLCAQAP